MTLSLINNDKSSKLKGRVLKWWGLRNKFVKSNWLKFISSYYSTFASVLKVVKPGENLYSARVDEWVCDGREDQDDCSRPQGNDSDTKDWAPLSSPDSRINGILSAAFSITNCCHIYTVSRRLFTWSSHVFELNLMYNIFLHYIEVDCSTSLFAKHFSSADQRGSAGRLLGLPRHGQVGEFYVFRMASH